MTVGGQRTPLVVLLCVVSSACRQTDAPRATAPATLSSGTVAVVADDPIAGATVERIAAARDVRPREALDAAVFDALLAAAARSSRSPWTVRVAERRASSRRVLEALHREAQAKGPPTDDELRIATQGRWWELDCPPLRRTIHAVVVVKPGSDDAAARALANQIAAAVAPARDAASFRALAGSVVAPKGLVVRVEDLTPVAADGRTVDPTSPRPAPGQFSPAFASAVFALENTERPSAVFRTEFGYHVVLVTETLPAHAVPAEERRSLLTPDVVNARAASLEAEVLERARSAAPVAIERSAMDLTARVDVAR